MQKNIRQKFSILTRLIHWLSALMVFALFGLGYWMVDLDYYSQWYQVAPHWHESFGILFLILTFIRILAVSVQNKPAPIISYSKIEMLLAHLMKLALYLVLFIIIFSGYLIPTADNRAIEIFNWFAVPSIGELFSNQESIAGVIHQYSAYLIIILAIFHAFAALKHHFIDKDETLKRMLFTVRKKVRPPEN